MDHERLRAIWSATVPPGYVRPADPPDNLPECSHTRCHNPVAIKRNGLPAKACQRCLDRRARSCKRRRAILVARGGCRRCAYRKRAEGDHLCDRCRAHNQRWRDDKKRDRRDAAAIDAFAAQPERIHRALDRDLGVSPWNARSKPEPSAAYWSPLPDPEPKATQEWRAAISDTGWRVSRH